MKEPNQTIKIIVWICFILFIGTLILLYQLKEQEHRLVCENNDGRYIDHICHIKEGEKYNAYYIIQVGTKYYLSKK